MRWSRRCTRQPWRHGALTHHSDRGSQYVDPLQRERHQPRAGIETLGGQHRRQLRQRAGRTINGAAQGRDHPPARAVEDARGRSRLATLEWSRKVQPPSAAGTIGYIPPAEAEGTLLAPASRKPPQQRSLPYRQRCRRVEPQSTWLTGAPAACGTGRKTNSQTRQTTRSDSANRPLPSKPGAVHSAVARAPLWRPAAPDDAQNVTHQGFTAGCGLGSTGVDARQHRQHHHRAAWPPAPKGLRTRAPTPRAARRQDWSLAPLLDLPPLRPAAAGGAAPGLRAPRPVGATAP